MWYRTDLYLHSHRIVWLLEELLPFALRVFPGFNIELARTMATVHDDLEISLGDIMLGDKVNFTPEQHAELYIQEQLAIEAVAQNYPDTINGFRYKQLMQRYQMFEEYSHPEMEIMMDDPETCLIKYCDKLDAFCEALHELHAGNSAFLNGYSTNNTPPIPVFIKVFSTFTQKFPLFKRMKIFTHPFLQVPLDIQPEMIVSNGKPHTRESIQHNTKFPFYDKWRQVSLAHGGSALMKRLTEKVE